ncbi:NAD(P)/FAD-dependent oxidoreductase [Aliiroseovarius crassostreae]|uniref:NAD(P)/FAD-dependent oxidoreductase n=1 Tax=Aliiroseovarius crassostreae TaxID=154981 RepID=UPI0021AF3C15|nr:FAD-dependent oxidoreductase [Aliiroseovarius crassostreae]UWP99886.1 FAD-dependent oxidoreductase [Aliiroseovarius crassostreae]
MSKRVVIIGGGFIGFELARALDRLADVTLIEAQTHFVHAPAMLRAVVNPDLLDRALIPYDKLLKRGRVIRARATQVLPDGVRLEGGETVPADFIVVATGAKNAAPFRPQSHDILEFRKELDRVHAQLLDARSVLIVGAGAVGVELAGEISHAFPDKMLTLISGATRLFPEFPQSLGKTITRKLRAAGVEIQFGQRATDLENRTIPYAGKVQLADGQELEADLVFPALGAEAKSDLLTSLPGVKIASCNRVKVDVWMRPSCYPNVFAAGDVADIGDAMTVVATTRQLPWLIKTFRAIVRGKTVEELRPYTPWARPPILLPLGPKHGASYLSYLTVGDIPTSLIKGRDLFLTKFNKAMGR